MIEISVVIGTRNQRPTLERVLASFANQTRPGASFEVVIVDSASTDGTASLCTGRCWPFSLRYSRRENSGKAAARNDAIRQAAAALVFLTDGDVLAHPDLLASHVASQGAHPGAAIVGRQVVVDTLEEIETGGRDALRPGRREGQRLRWNELVTGNVSMPRQVLLDAGVFDEDFVGYGYEDYELGYRLARRGVPILFQPSAVNYHWHPVRFEDDLGRKREAGRSAVLFCRKHPSPWLRWRIGVHPVNRRLWGAVGEDGRLLRTCRRWAPLRSKRGRAARSILLEWAFQQGVREALNSR
jgi:GT2 family glycosyltransferase